MIYRTLRYLDPDHTTRTEIHWSPVAGALTPTRTQRKERSDLTFDSFEDYIIRLTAVQQRPDYSDRIVNQNHYLIQDVRSTKETTIPVQQMAVRGDTGLFHVALQWDQHVVLQQAGVDGKIQLGPHLKVSTERIDSLAALAADPAVLEMSDVKPILVQEDEVFFEIDRAAAAPAYPFETINRDQVFALYFEVYNLTFGADDLTQYGIDYELVRKRDGLRLFSNKEGDRTGAQTIYTGTNRIAREIILLDLAVFGGSGSLEMTIRVTDQQSGQSTSRRLTFEVL